jgi:multidrug efflux pump subunit AcrA (membrane-fusion protein)
MEKIIGILKKKKLLIIIAAVIIILGVGAYFVFGGNGKVEYITAKIERGKIIQTVSETGTVKAAKELDLNFLQSGKIAKINVKVGDKVSKDQILAELDYATLKINEQKAGASLTGAEASLSKLLAGAASGEIEVSQANVNQAKASYESSLRELEKTKKTAAENLAQAQKTLNDLKSKASSDITPQEQAVAVAQSNLENTISTYQKSINNKRDSALTTIEAKISTAKSALDAVNRIITDEDAKDILSVKNTTYLDLTKNSYAEAGDSISRSEASLNKAKASQNQYEVEAAANDSLTALNKVFICLNYCFKALENSIITFSFTQTELDTFKTSVNTQIANITSAVSSVEAAKQNLADAQLSYETNTISAQKNLAQAQANLDNAILTAQNALASADLNSDQQITIAENRTDSYYKAYQVAKAQLAQLKSPARPQDIALAKAQVEQAQAGLAEVKKQIENSIIKAPLDGTIIKVNYEIGEDAALTKAVISMLGNNNLEIEILISEADIAKVKKDQEAQITLDAFGGDKKFLSKVYFIEPAETIIQDVIYYKTKLMFMDLKEGEVNLAQIKSGMTANAIINTAQKENVLIAPNRAIMEKDGKKIIRILRAGELVEMPITVGLKGDGGMVEILTGVEEGDLAITSVKEGK